ncbi:UDP-N-acetylmuramate--L-alanine ligase [Ferruginibacter paludis]|uniref:UDP-N-acetylmuramate--L-alanine ligase n=1 Tax=Ferruginibacter paludis TaxID=1310417 RepID=UPI0025B3E435|nr:UDP-N-acetylmuramate--L-alanine ligase [Ferruginibacter paludis]MDN3657751.1 UDP-N-acetylmuramate--L-alanine ligase [Ferruginibacter paludis]
MNNYNNILTSLKIKPVAENETAAIYFLGIGGIGMSALARYFNSIGVRVSGYDKTPTALTRQLTAEGINIHFEDSVELIDKAVQLVVYTPAVPVNHTELNFYQQHNYTVIKRSDVLQAITENSYNVCIAGTHGKTTTSTMVAHILTHSGFGCNAFLGGIAVNYDTNFWGSEKNVCVVEADEYDRSFLKLSPDVAIISSMDPDHLDIYGTAENMEQAFIDFSARIKPGGLLLSKFGLERGKELRGDQRLTYHLDNSNADVYATNITMSNGSYHFDVVKAKEGSAGNSILKNVVLNMGGLHNIENVLAAIGVAHHLQIDDNKITDAVAAFRGVKRRFEYIVKAEKLVYIDDYAHHPEELRALITGAKKLFANKKCVVVFQPHLFSRTKDLADGFAEVLDLADEIILLPIYPARELPMEGVSSDMIIERMHSESKMVLSKENLLKHLAQEKEAHVEEGFEGTLIITAGAGDIDTLIEPIKAIIEKK